MKMSLDFCATAGCATPELSDTAKLLLLTMLADPAGASRARFLPSDLSWRIGCSVTEAVEALEELIATGAVVCTTE